jgi:prephenate dehydratase
MFTITANLFQNPFKALGQCSNYLSAHLPQAKRREFVSTASAASFLASREDEETKHGAAICSQSIADKLGDRLQLMASGIQNVKGMQHTLKLSVVTDAPLPC